MSRPRLAWFTPLPPVRSGVAAYNAELLPRLAASYGIDVFVEDLDPVAEVLGWPVGESAGRRPAGSRLVLRNAHDFVWLNARHPYDLVVYQLGNELCHDYLWAYLVRYPGLVVLHDGQLHHARALALLRRGRTEDYRAEFVFSHPEAPSGAASVGALGLLGLLQYFWPMLRVPVTAARAVAVHSPWLAADLSEQFPDVPVHVVRMGVADPLAPAPEDAKRGDDSRQQDPVPLPAAAATGAVLDGLAVRARYGIPQDVLLVTVFGRLTPEKRIDPAIRAVRAVAAEGMRAHLLLVGERAPYYDLAADVARAGAAELVTVTGYVADHDLPRVLAAADVCLCLRWPSSRETSAAWLRCLAAGKPTVVTDLAHTVDVAALDPRDWAVLPAALPETVRFPMQDGPRGHTDKAPLGSGTDEARSPEAVGRAGSGDPVCIAVDILDEDHSLALALERLARDPALRARLGSAARAYYEAGHTLAHMVAEYEQVIDRVLKATTVDRAMQARAAFPAHLRQGWTAHARALAAALGVTVDFLDA